MRVKISELRFITDAVLAHPENVGYSTLEIAEDYYWDVPPPERHDPYAEAPQMGLGQLTDDWSELQKIVAKTEEPNAYGLVRLSGSPRSYE
jgi:hypothetical protein